MRSSACGSAASSGSTRVREKSCLTSATSSPNADALWAYFQYCADQNDPSKLSKFGILFKSSYARLRVYRVRAYRRCAAYSCGADLVAFTELRGFSMLFSKACNEVFNASVAALEYLNEDNVAVTFRVHRDFVP